VPITPDDWTRLGELLVRRRIELDPRYVNRQLFSNERGVHYRTVSDIERHRRDNYEAVTIAAIEVAYALTPGSIGRVLAGGELEPLPSAPAVELAPVVPLSLDGDEETLVRSIVDLPSPAGGGKLVAWETRRGMLRSLIDLNDRRRSSQAGLHPPPLQPKLVFCKSEDGVQVPGVSRRGAAAGAVAHVRLRPRRMEPDPRSTP
jgi:hypothetical protein